MAMAVAIQLQQMGPQMASAIHGPKLVTSWALRVFITSAAGQMREREPARNAGAIDRAQFFCAQLPRAHARNDSSLLVL